MKTYLIKIAPENQQNAAAFEQVLVQLHETLRGKKASFEMVAMGQNIGFCFTADAATAEVVSGQIYGMCPDADITETKDFTRDITKSTQLLTTEIRLNRSDLFPIKTFPEFEGDSLAGVLSVLGKCSPDEGIWLQIVCKPQTDSGSLHFAFGIRRKLDRIQHMFRVKYWFKKGAGKQFGDKIKEKISERLFECNVRVATFTKDPKKSPETKMQAALGALSNFNTLDLNRIKPLQTRRGLPGAKAFHTRQLKSPFFLSTKELATLFHLPNEKEVPNIIHVLSRKGEPPADLPTDGKDGDVSLFGETNFHGKAIPFGIQRSDRRRHLYTIGKSGSGKSKLLELLIKNDIESGRGVGVLDPHGDLVDNILKFIPKNRVKDVVFFDPSDLEFPVSFNPLEQVPQELKTRVTIGFIEIFKKLFGSNWSPRLEHVLRYTTLALLDTPNTTVLSILKMLTDKNYRQMIVANIQDDVVKNFWVSEFAGWSQKFDNEAITPLLNKVGQFVSTNMIRNIVGQPENKIDFRDIMDNQKIFLMKVSKGMLGEENSALLGAIAVTKIYQAAMSRADTPEADRVDFYLYVDEFHNFTTDTFGEILSEARKYRLNLTLAHQFLGQLSDKMRKTVFGNVGSLLSFRTGAEDAKLLAEEFAPRFSERDIINLGVRDFYTKMTIGGELREAFSGRTLDIEIPQKNQADECKEFSRKTYAKPEREVQKILKQWEEGNEGKMKASSGSNGDKYEEPII